MKGVFNGSNILDNLGLKIVGLFLALLLWLHVATNRDYETSITYDFRYTGLPDSLVLGSAPPERTTVLAQGSGKQLLRLIWQERVWAIGLQDAQPGSLRVPLSPGQAPSYGIDGLQFLALEGESELRLVIDSVAERNVPIISDCIIEPASEFMRTGPDVWTPARATVRGPAGVVAGIDAVYSEHVELSGLTAPLEREFAIATPALYSISVVPQKAVLKVPIERRSNRLFVDQKVEVVIARGSDSFAVEPGLVAVEVSGPESALTVFSEDSITVRCVVGREDTTGTRRSLWVRVPEPLRVLKTAPDSVTVIRHERPRTRARS